MKKYLIIGIIIIVAIVVAVINKNQTIDAEVIENKSSVQNIEKAHVQNTTEIDETSKFSNVSEMNEELKFFLQYMAFLNEEKDVQYTGMTKPGIKLDIASYHAESFIYDESLGLLSYKRQDIENAMKELFNETIDLKTESAYGLKYKEDIDSFAYEAGGDGYVSTYLVKVEEAKDLGGGLHSITFIYAYPSEADFFDETLPECDCFRTQIEYIENENYNYSKYQLVNEEKMSSNPVGKIKDYL